MKTINRKNLPTKLPLTLTVVCFLCLDYWNAPGYVWGIVGTILFFLWSVSVYKIWNEKSVDVFEDNQKKQKRETPSKFQEKLKKMQEQ